MWRYQNTRKYRPMEEWDGDVFTWNAGKEDIYTLIESILRLLKNGCKGMENMVVKYLGTGATDSLYMYFPWLRGRDLESRLSVEHQIDRFWKIRFELHEERTNSMDRYEDIVSSFLALDTKCGILGKLEGQMALVDEIRRIYSITSQGSPRKKRLREYRLHGTLCLHPGAGSMRLYASLFSLDATVKEIIFPEIEIFPSSTFPILVPLRTDRGVSRIIYKKGDDLTRDLFVLETIRYMSRLMGVDLVTYKVIPLSRKEGIIEVVDGIDFTRIRSRKDLEMYIEEDRDPRHQESFEKRKVFVSTLCGYSVACYVMGIGDRNPGNMMVTRDGKFFHIDFSHVFGRDPKPISSRITIARPIRDYLVNDELIYQDFLARSGEAFLQIRRSCRKIFVLWCILAQNRIFQFDLNEIIPFAQARLRMEMSEQRALELFEKEIRGAVGSLKTSVAHLINRVGMFLRR
uniref:Phosphatidyl inositol-3-kinase n=1 Tax=Encephalitozoon cuniculi TaxID=6035 RepID=M1KLS1_ENCCN|nr:phosphatidyl inositol-3-kinase [Encephalitozoon cuniculi]